MKTFGRRNIYVRNGLFVDLPSSMAVRMKVILQLRKIIFPIIVLRTACLNLQPEINTNKTDNVRVNVISRLFRVPIVAVGKN